MSLVYTLGGIISTNFIAWATIVIITVLSMANVKVFPYLESVFGLILFPVNALVNPMFSLNSRNKSKQQGTNVRTQSSMGSATGQSTVT